MKKLIVNAENLTFYTVDGRTIHDIYRNSPDCFINHTRHANRGFYFAQMYFTEFPWVADMRDVIAELETIPDAVVFPSSRHLWSVGRNVKGVDFRLLDVIDALNDDECAKWKKINFIAEAGFYIYGSWTLPLVHLAQSHPDKDFSFYFSNDGIYYELAASIPDYAETGQAAMQKAFSKLVMEMLNND